MCAVDAGKVDLGFDWEWSAAAGQDWQTAALSDACQELQESTPDPELVRLSLLSSLDASLREGCNGTRHAPTLWLAGDAKLKFGERWLDIGATGDCMGLTASALYRLTEINTGATHYRLIENRISFERVSRLLNTSRDELAI